MSGLEAHKGIFRLLMKGIFATYVLWPFDKKLFCKLVRGVRTSNYTVCESLFKIDPSNLTSTCWQKRITHIGGGCLHHHMTTFLSHIYFVWDMWSLNCLAGKIDLIFWKTRQIVACRACSLAPALKWNKDFYFLRKEENLSFPPPTSNILVPSVH